MSQSVPDSTAKLLRIHTVTSNFFSASDTNNSMFLTNYYYDLKGFMIGSTQINPNTSKVMFSFENKYNRKGLIVRNKMITYFPKNVIKGKRFELKKYRSKNKYDDNGRLIEKIYRNKDMATNETFDYDSLNRKIKSIVYWGDTIKEETKTEYIDNGLIETYTRNEKGFEYPPLKNYYFTDKFGLIRRKTLYSGDFFTYEYIFY